VDERVPEGTLVPGFMDSCFVKTGSSSVPGSPPNFRAAVNLSLVAGSSVARRWQAILSKSLFLVSEFDNRLPHGRRNVVHLAFGIDDSLGIGGIIN
jgi:hypothetical protein